MIKKEPRTLIVCVSRHLGNTLKVANTIASVLKADLISPADFSPELAAAYDLLGFGSGVYRQQLDSKIREVISLLPDGDSKPVFLFSTSVFGVKEPHQEIKDRLVKIHYPVIGEFSCPGKISYSFTKVFGGLNPTRPNASDLDEAVFFAKGLLNNSVFSKTNKNNNLLDKN